MEAPSMELVAPLVVSIPRIRTKNLLLREFRMADFDGFAANLADPMATEFLSGTTDRRTAWRIFTSGAGSWAVQGKGWWILESRESGEVVGTVGAFEREGNPDVELGWTLYPKFWKRGFAVEAATAARDHAMNAWQAKRIIAHIADGNAPSIAVSKRIGMHHEGVIDFYGEPCGRYALEVK